VKRLIHTWYYSFLLETSHPYVKWLIHMAINDLIHDVLLCRDSFCHDPWNRCVMNINEVIDMCDMANS